MQARVVSSPLLGQWAEAGTPDTGCILIAADGQHQFGLILDRVAETLRGRPLQEEWTDRAVVVSRAK